MKASMKNPMKYTLVLLFVLFATNFLKAQKVREGNAPD